MLASRLWNKPSTSFSIFDSLGRLCRPHQMTSKLIQRMMLEDVTPLFVVRELKTSLKKFGKGVVVEGGAIQWIERVLFSFSFSFFPFYRSLLKILIFFFFFFFFPQSLLIPFIFLFPSPFLVNHLSYRPQVFFCLSIKHFPSISYAFIRYRLRQNQRENLGFQKYFSSPIPRALNLLYFFFFYYNFPILWPLFHVFTLCSNSLLKFSNNSKQFMILLQKKIKISQRNH